MYHKEKGKKKRKRKHILIRKTKNNTALKLMLCPTFTPARLLYEKTFLPLNELTT